MLGSLINLVPLAFEFKLGAFILALFVLIGCYYSFRTQHHSAEDEGDDSDQHHYEATHNVTIPPMPESLPTIAIDNQSVAPPSNSNVSVETSGNPPPWRHLHRPSIFRELVTENDTHWLVIHTYTPVPQGLFKKKLWKHKIQKLELDDSPDVNIRLATKIPIRPTDGETKIYHLQRLHWLSHGPTQLGIAVGTLLVMWLLSFESLQDGGADLPIGPLLILGVSGGVWYYLVWIHWAYKYLIFTNLKIRLSYVPPFKLPRKTPSTDLASLQGGTDPSSGVIGNIFGYGRIRTETVANFVDDWLLKSVRFVKNYERVALLLDQLRENIANAKQDQ